jgi:hypothetical protein
MKDKLEQLYSFTLMEGGGSIEGYRVTGAEAKAVREGLNRLASPEVIEKKYGNNKTCCLRCG